VLALHHHSPQSRIVMWISLSIRRRTCCEAGVILSAGTHDFFAIFANPFEAKIVNL